MDTTKTNCGEKPPVENTGQPASLPNALYAQNVAAACDIDSRRTFGGDWASRTAIVSLGDKSDKVKDTIGENDVQIIRFSDPGRINDPNGNRQKTSKSVHDGYDSDVISGYIGHYGKWQFFWTFLICLFQLPCTFEIFIFVFQVC